MVKLYAAIDTNVIISAMLTHNPESPTLEVLEAALDGRITYLYNHKVINELFEVIKRPKLRIPFEKATIMILSLISSGIEVSCTCETDSIIRDSFSDVDDYAFYEIVSSYEHNAYLVTGNLKHFPSEPWIIAPKEMCDIIDAKGE